MRYIIEVEDIGNGLWRAKGFNTLVFDQNGLARLNRLDKTYEEGCEDGYRFAAAMHNSSESTEENKWYHENGIPLAYEMTYGRAKEWYDTWKREKDAIHVGDEIKLNGTEDTMIVTCITDDAYYRGFGGNGDIKEFDAQNVFKTGRHIDLSEVVVDG